LGDVWLPQIVGRIVRAVDPVRILLFGSRARGDSRPDSDYDLLVILDVADDRRALRLQVRSAIDDLPISKDVVVASVDQVGERQGRIWGVLHWALQEGVLIYARA
jgi:predicted nucleotidyltransferase